MKRPAQLKVGMIFITIVTQIIVAACISEPENSLRSEQNVSLTSRTHNLIPIHDAAQLATNTGEIIEFQSKWKLESYLLSGWYTSHQDSQERPIYVTNQSAAVLRFTIVTPETRLFTFQFNNSGKYGNLASQQIDISLNGESVGTIKIIKPGWNSLSIQLPVKNQRIGFNRLEMAFSNQHENRIELDSKATSIPLPRIVTGYFSDMAFQITPDGKDGYVPFSPLKPLRLNSNGNFLIQKANTSICFTFPVYKNSLIKLQGIINESRRSLDSLNVLVQWRSDSELSWRTIKQFLPEEISAPQGISLNTEVVTNADEKYAQLRIVVTDGKSDAKDTVLWKELTVEAAEAKTEMANTQPSNTSLPDVENVIIILLDASRADDLGAYGGDFNISPNIDEFARQATVFENAITAAPYTRASIASLFSGLLPERHGVRHDKSHFPPHLPLLGKAMAEAGFYCLALNDNPLNTTKLGSLGGFDRDIRMGDSELRKLGYNAIDYDLVEKEIAAAASIGKKKFIYFHLLPPHEYYTPPPPFNLVNDEDLLSGNRGYVQPSVLNPLITGGWITRDHPWSQQLRRAYLANYKSADHMVGQIIKNLKAAGMYDNSLIIITSDHGEGMGEHNWFDHNSVLYDELVKIPLIIKLPGQNTPTRVETSVSLVDIFPTLDQLLALDVDTNFMDGRSIIPLLSASDSMPDIWQYSRATGERLKYCYRNKHYKYLRHSYTEEFYDLVNDPGETTNIIDQHPLLAAFLQQQGMVIAINENKLNAGVNYSQDELQELKDLGYIQ